jgi:hypothetical protein
METLTYLPETAPNVRCSSARPVVLHVRRLKRDTRKESTVSANPEGFIELGGPGGPITYLALQMPPDSRITSDVEGGATAAVGPRKESACANILGWTGDLLIAVEAWLKTQARPRGREGTS